MTPKEKAKEFVNKYGKDVSLNIVDELIEAFDYQVADYGDDYPTTHKYWKEVKYEILLLNMQQTTVEWLVDNLKEKYPNIEDYSLLIGIAKEMDKEQKIAFANQFAEAVMGGCLLTPTEFYNETFKSE